MANSNKTTITRHDEEKFLQLKIAENPIFSGALTFDEIIGHISRGDLMLEVSDDDGTEIMDDSSIDEIKKVMPSLLKIVDKPRSFIKSLEEKVPVETAKRINHKAIVKLSQDSNDWYARTVLSVKPKNIVSDINEESIDLYENRFICALTNKISKLLIQARQFYQEQLKIMDENSTINAISKEYNYSTNSFQFFNKISKKMYAFQDDMSYRKKIEDKLNEIRNIEKKINLIKRSDFYRFLNKKRKVIDPIQKTNILIFEFNYNQAYKLWKYLKQNNQTEKLELDVSLKEENLNTFYHLYNTMCIFSSLYDLNFTEESGNKFIYDNVNGRMEGKFKFIRDDIIINVIVDNTQVKASMESPRIKKSDDFYFYSNFTNFEKMSRSEVDDFTETLLNQLLITGKFTTTTSKYALLSINMSRCSENNTFSNKVYRRFYSIGNNYAEDESKKNLKNWNNYKVGIVMLSPVQLRRNFLKIEKIFNYHILKQTDFNQSITVCPLCGGVNVRKTGENSYTCFDCSHNISITFCNDCDPEHKKPIIWAKYLDDRFLKNDNIVNDLLNLSVYNKLSKIENIMGEKATTGFELEHENNTWKLKTICPYCGIKLGDSRSK